MELKIPRFYFFDRFYTILHNYGPKQSSASPDSGFITGHGDVVQSPQTGPLTPTRLHLKVLYPDANLESVALAVSVEHEVVGSLVTALDPKNSSLLSLLLFPSLHV